MPFTSLYLHMAFILGIETATEVCSVALFSNQNLLALREWKEGNKHANELTTLISEVVKEASISLNQLDAICVSMGPGSYTGLRVGVSTAKGLCYTLNKPLIAVNTLESMAQVFVSNNPNYNGLVCPMIDARRMEVYTALFNNNGEPVRETEAKIIDETSFAQDLQLGNIAFIGNGAEKCREVIEHSNAQFHGDLRCSAVGLGKLAGEKFNAKQFEDVAYFEPFYLKDFVGTTPKKK